MPTLVDTEFFARLNALNEKFAASVPDTLSRLDALRGRFDPAAPDMDLVRELHQILHTVAGSAATFGFRVLGHQARQLEQRLRVLMAFEAVAPRDWQNWMEDLNDYIGWGQADPRGEDYIDVAGQ
jgi:HPt (histidine-containing phosphotransfer) domain-containing protein